MKKPYYNLDEDTVDMLNEVIEMALTFVDIQVSPEVREDMYAIIGELHERFNLPDIVETINDPNNYDPDDSTIVPIRKFGKPTFGVIIGGRDKDNDK